MVLSQPAGGSMTAATLLEAVACGGARGDPTLSRLRGRLASGELQTLTATCAVVPHCPVLSELGTREAQPCCRHKSPIYTAGLLHLCARSYAGLRGAASC